MMATKVECPICGVVFNGGGTSGTVVPGHGEKWTPCPGSYATVTPTTTRPR